MHSAYNKTTLDPRLLAAAIAVAAFSSLVFAGSMLSNLLGFSAYAAVFPRIYEPPTPTRSLIIHAHRGGAGMRAESTGLVNSDPRTEC